jgi:predicted DNA-binding protein YlxM (UPF0122 family)
MDVKTDETERFVKDDRLYGYYGGLLTEHQRDIYEKAFYQDLSLREIAQEEGVSKQAVHDLLRRCTATLEDCERKLGYMALTDRVNALTDELSDAAAGEHSIEALAGKTAAVAAEIRRLIN